jgi:hypothetical protein
MAQAEPQPDPSCGDVGTHLGHLVVGQDISIHRPGLAAGPVQAPAGEGGGPSSKVDVADPVEGVLDGPVSLDSGGDDSWLGVLHGHGADGVHDLDLCATVDDSGPADLQDLGGAGPVDPRRIWTGLSVRVMLRPWRRSRWVCPGTFAQGRSLSLFRRPGWFPLTVST